MATADAMITAVFAVLLSFCHVDRLAVSTGALAVAPVGVGSFSAVPKLVVDGED